MSAILTKMTECLEFMKRQGACESAIFDMEDAIAWQKMDEGLDAMVEREGPGGQGKTEEP